MWVAAAIADDFYHLYQSDIGLLQQLGAKHFRMSISWPRIYPNGDGAVNQKGLDFYSNLVDALLAAGIEPHVTLYHWDLPQVTMLAASSLACCSALPSAGIGIAQCAASN